MSTNQLIEDNHFVHREHKDWLNQLNFYQDEIKFFQNELALLLRKHFDSLSILENTEEYKTIFLKKLQHIDELRHQIMLHEKELSSKIKEDIDNLKSHQATRDKFLAFVADFEMLKKNFRRFAAHND